MGTLKTAIQNLLGWNSQTPVQKSFYNKNGFSFSSFGDNIQVNDIVKTAIHRVAEAVSKCELKSIIEKYDPVLRCRSIEVANDDINAAFTSRVNPLCGLKDFLYKVTYILLIHKNCFVYWAYDEVPIEGTKYVRRVTRGFYPIEAANVKLYMKDGEMRVELTSTDNSIVLDLPYSDVIHIRHTYGANKFLGGNAEGKADNRDLLSNLQTMHIIKEAIPKSLEASLSLKGILTMRTVADADKIKITRDEFEQHLFDSKYGIVATDYESDFVPININATDIPSNILTLLRDEILSPFGVSLPIYLGKYTDDDYTAFYQTAIEGILIEIATAMKIVLFTPRQLSYGHTIKFYDKLVQSLSFNRRQQIAEMTKEDALLSRDERRELLGYEPDGEPTRVSLNYIDTSIANQYQLETLNPQKKQNKEDENATASN